MHGQIFSSSDQDRSGIKFLAKPAFSHTKPDRQSASTRLPVDTSQLSEVSVSAKQML
jgi:hypothetical protein